jgi:hypothetical protein
VRLCLCGTAAANGPTAPPPDDTWVNMKQQWNDTDRENWRTRRKSYPSAILSTRNYTWTALAANPGLRDEKPATNRLSYGAADWGKPRALSVRIVDSRSEIPFQCQAENKILHDLGSGLVVSYLHSCCLHVRSWEPQNNWALCCVPAHFGTSPSQLAVYFDECCFKCGCHVYGLSLRCGRERGRGDRS